ncbi:MAG: hypothetical protein IPM54_09975 [Polyangiaceae bacterium]|nr:hypothetical protein [Polyangiaceae bacterium]
MGTSESTLSFNGDTEKVASTFGEELRALVRLGLPIVLSNAGAQVLGFVDTAMVGRLDAVALAAVGIGNAVYFTISIVAMGLVLGMDPLVSQAIGAGDRAGARAVLWQAVRISLIGSIPAIILAFFASAFVGKIGIDAETSKSVFHYVSGRLFNVVPFLIATAGRTYLQAIGQPGPAVWAYVWTNVANVVGNYLLIYGDPGLVKLGLPAIGIPTLGGIWRGSFVDVVFIRDRRNHFSRHRQTRRQPSTRGLSQRQGHHRAHLSNWLAHFDASIGGGRRIRAGGYFCRMAWSEGRRGASGGARLGQHVLRIRAWCIERYGGARWICRGSK